MKLLISLTLILISSTLIVSKNEVDTIDKILKQFIDGKVKDLFKVWHLLYEKSYTMDTKEAITRFTNFKANLQYIKKENAKNLSYSLGLNQFSDMSNEEFQSVYGTETAVTGKELDAILTNEQFLRVEDDDDDDLSKRFLQSRTAIDWKQYFQPARNQGSCGSCWTFSAAGSLEGNISLKTQSLMTHLSTQNLVDCDTASNKGCNGGNYFAAFDGYIKKNGLHYEKDYTYKGVQEVCKDNQSLKHFKNISYNYCTNYSTNTKDKCSIQKVYDLLKEGPLSVSIDGGSRAFQSYKSGIFSGACTTRNHAVVMVGYGIDTVTGVHYWVIRNSWASTWGEQGYGRVAVNDANNLSCFLNIQALRPTPLL
jgi:C1A family cysteine protease